MENQFNELKKNTELFDINCYIPFYADKFLEDEPVTPEKLLEEGINKLVLSTKRYQQNEVFVANEELIERVAGNDAFYAAPVITPEMSLAGNDFKKYMSRLIDNKAVIVRAFPTYFKHSMKKWQMGEIFKTLEDFRIPLMLWHMEVSFDTYAEIAENYPNLPVIIEGSDQKTIYYVRDFMALGEKYPNIYFEMHNFSQHGFLPYLLKHIGAERLLFGSCAPYNDFNGVINMIASHASQEEKELICSKNFERLLSNIKK